ncbi:MAG: hypothetical protein GY720_12115 [bacterium]|nr:hypothetical protein [bacterium]
MTGAVPQRRPRNGATIRRLSEQLQETSSVAWARVEARIVRERRLIDSKNCTLRRKEQKRGELVAKRSWARSELHGLTRSMGILTKLADDGAQEVGLFLTRRLDLLQRTATHLDSTIQEVEHRIADLRAEVAAHIDTALGLLQKCLGEAEKAKAVAEPDASETDTYWSPVPVLGFRVWTVTARGLIGGRQPWTSSHKTAHCLKAGSVPHTDDRCATVAFGCGIYAMKSIDRLTKRSLGNRPLAFGVTTLEGKVVEHEHGYRARSVTARALAILDRRVVRLIHEEGEVDEMFANPAAQRTLGYIPGPQPTSPPRNLTLICRYLNNEARRISAWT